ncbi:MAG TPA: hypothetical protein VEA44_05905 [Caulobacter sp.]|nr:hypothetical protein [Caulobacter sp.]
MATLSERLEGYLGKNINRICGNRFHDPSANHCAHFVGHALGLTASYNCVDFKGGSKPGSNIRVHETFSHCSKVGDWNKADLTRTQLCFVTRKNAVDLAAKTMMNIPEKHIGVFHDGWVYHYSNTNDAVVKQRPADFLARFQAAYSGDQGLFFGIPDAVNLNLNITPAAQAPAQVHAFDLIGPDDRYWRAKRRGDAADFLVGREIIQPAKTFWGLYMPAGDYYGPVYKGDDYVAGLGHWAYLLEATGHCESGNRFNLFNTYDRAKFTFGFYQLAAHTPRDNLILLFRALMASPEMAAYFPELKMVNGRLCRVDAVNGATDLEFEFQNGDEIQLAHFMNYLNPNRKLIDTQEILMAARLVHWANTSAEHRRIQVQVAADILQRKMTQRYQPWFNLDGKSDIVCLIIADILHQGRGGKQLIKAALASAKPVDALSEIGKAKYPERVTALKAVIQRLQTAGKIGHKRYDAAQNAFV